MKRIEWTDQAKADVRKLDRPTAMRVLHALHGFAKSGAGDLKALQGEAEELRLRIGNYRLLNDLLGFFGNDFSQSRMCDCCKSFNNSPSQCGGNNPRQFIKRFNPQGFNIGANVGAPAGAGIAEHFHMHLVPRWLGDTNFMSTVSGTRVISEALDDTYQRVCAAWKTI